jgi:hypothetical protein
VCGGGLSWRKRCLKGTFSSKKSPIMRLLTLIVLCGIFSSVFGSLHDEYLKLSRRTQGLETPPADWDSYPFTASSKNQLVTKHVTGQYSSTGRDYSAFFASFHPSSFSFMPPNADGCTSLQVTSVSAVAPWHDFCEYATNGGFFNMGGPVNGSYCIGNLIGPQGNVVQIPTDSTGNRRTQLGITADFRVVTGILDASTVASLGGGFTELLTGYGWLIRKGVVNVNSTVDIPQPANNVSFVMEKAPRTALGVLSSGMMGILEIDGEEDIQAGPDLFEMAELGVELGFVSLVNIDGGGSAVSVQNGQVISKPTCNDTPVVCERPDASLTCVRKDKDTGAVL